MYVWICDNGLLLFIIPDKDEGKRVPKKRSIAKKKAGIKAVIIVLVLKIYFRYSKFIILLFPFQYANIEEDLQLIQILLPILKKV